MYIHDFAGEASVGSEEDLVQRLRSRRRGIYGAFVLWHEDDGPSLWIHTNKEIAYVHFFPHKAHPGFQPTGMAPAECVEPVRFLDTGGMEADSIVMPAETLVPAGLAYRAAVEFLNEPSAPKSIAWFEL